jgi:hypothetical protein
MWKLPVNPLDQLFDIIVFGRIGLFKILASTGINGFRQVLLRKFNAISIEHKLAESLPIPCEISLAV